MATIKGTFTSGQIVKTNVFQTGGLQLSYWNTYTSQPGYFYGNTLADLIAAQTGAPSNLYNMSWPNPQNAAVGVDSETTEKYDIDNQRYFTLTTRVNNLGSGFTYPYNVILTLRCYWQNQLAGAFSVTNSFNAAQFANVLANTGSGMLQSVSQRLSDPVFGVYSYPINSPSEDYDRFEDYDKGYAVRSIHSGSWTDGTSQLYSYHDSTQGASGTEITNIGNVQTNAEWLHFIWDIKEPAIPTSEPDESFGGYDNSSDTGSVPGVPGVDMVLTKLVRLYQPTAQQMGDFSDFLWAIGWQDFQKIIDSLKQWFSNPLETIVSVNMMPVDYFYDYISGTAVIPSSTHIIMAGIDTGREAPPCTSNFKQVDCGTINLAPYFKSFLDCNPYTKYTIYLPYVGFREIDSNALFAPNGANLNVVYNVDLITGCFTCFLHITKENANTELSHVLYSYSGNMATQIPLSSANMNDFIRTIGMAAAGVSLAAVTGGASAAVVGAGAHALLGGASSNDMNISHGGNLSMESGYLGIQYPYLIVERPRESFPEGYNHILGKPSDVGGILDDFPGYTVVKECHLDGVPATDAEKDEINRLLKEGVIV